MSETNHPSATFALFLSQRSFKAAILIAICCIGCNERAQQRIAEKAISRTFDLKKGHFIVHGKAVYRSWNASEGRMSEELPDADVATFRALKQSEDANTLFAVDATNVFMGPKKLDDADGGTFELLTSNGMFARDARRVFFQGFPIADADPKTFKTLSYPFGRDEDRAYVGTIQIPVKDLDSWTPLEPGSAINPWELSRSKSPLAKKFTLGSGWSRDKFQLYFGERPMPEAEVLTFRILSNDYAKDGQHVYYGKDVLAGADPATFAVHDGPYIPNTKIHSGDGPDAHDAKRSYRSGKPVP